MAEAGVPAGNIPSWNGLMAPPGTPRELATRVAAEVALALNTPSLRSALETQSFQVAGTSTSQVMGEAVESVTLAWSNFVRDYDIRQE